MELALINNGRLFIEEYLYKPNEGIHVIVVKNETPTIYNLEITKKVSSMNINEIYKQRVVGNNTTNFNFPISDRVQPDEIVLGIDYENSVYDSSTEEFTIPYDIPEGNDTFNVTVYDIVVKNTNGAVINTVSYTPQNELVNGLSHMYLKMDGSRNPLVSPQYATAYPISDNLKGEFVYANLSKLNEVFFHIIGRDAGGNFSPESIVSIDIEPPPKVTSGFTVNFERIYNGHVITSINSNIILNFDNVQTSRGLEVFYDIEMISRNKATNEEEIVGDSYSGINNPANLDMNFTVRDYDTDNYYFYFRVKTYNRYGRTLGYSNSPVFEFRNQVSFSIDYVRFLDNPFIPIHPTSYAVNSINKTMLIGYSGKTDGYDNYIKVQYRAMDTRNRTYTEWKDLGEVNAFMNSGEVRLNFNTFKLSPNGFNIYDFRVYKSVDASSVVNRYIYNLFGDTFSLNMSNSDHMFEAIKIPIEALSEQNSIVNFNVDGEKYSIPFSVDKNNVITATRTSDMTIMASNKPVSSTLLTNEKDFKEMTEEVFTSYKATVVGSNDNIKTVYNRDVDYFVIIDKGTTSDSYWGNKTYTNVNSYISTLNNISSDIQLENSSPVLVNNKYTIVRVRNIPVPTIEFDKEPDGLDADVYYFHSPFKVITSTASGVSKEVRYEYMQLDDPNSITDFNNNYTNEVIEEEGEYLFLARSYIIYMGIKYFSDDANARIRLLVPDGEFILPIFNQIYETNGNLTLTINTKNNDSEYSYRVYNPNTNIDYDYTTQVVNGERTFRMSFSEDGVYVVAVNISFRGATETVYRTVSMSRVNDEELDANTLIHYHKSSDTEDNLRYNSMLLETKDGDSENFFYAVDYKRQGESSTRRYIISPGYKVPIFDPGEMRSVVSRIDIDKRDHIHDTHDPTTSQNDPFNNSVSDHHVTTGDTIITDKIDRDSIPEVPLVRLTSENPMNPFYPDPVGEDTSVAYDSITINVINESSEYDTELLIDGIKYDSGVKFDKSGFHSCIVIFKDKYNYNFNYTKFDFNILKDSSFSPIKFSYTPEDKYNPSYDVTIQYAFKTSEENPEEDHIDRKEYQLITESSTSEWLTYNGIITDITEPTTIRARKVMVSGLVIYEEFKVTAEMLGYNLPIPPVIIIRNNMEFVYPNIQKEINHEYEFKVNGTPYELGQPLVDYSNNSNSNGTTYEIEAISKHYKFPDRTARSIRNITVNASIPPKPVFEGTNNNKLNLENLNSNYRLNIINNTEPHYQNRLIVNGEEYPNNTLLSSINPDLNGQYEVVLITKNKNNGMFSHNGYYIDNNRNSSSRYHTLDQEEHPRNVFITRTRDESLPVFTNELLQDFRTGDLAYYNGEKIVDITYDIREELLRMEKEITNNISMASDIRSRKDYLSDHVDNIVSNNQMLKNTIDIAIQNIKNIDASLEEVEKINTQISDLLMSINDKKSSKDDLLSQNNYLEANIQETNLQFNTILDAIDSQMNDIEYISKMKFNLRSVELNTIRRVDKSSFNRFKNKHEGFLNQLTNIVDRF